MPVLLQDIWCFVRVVLLRFRQDRCLQLASSLTFTTLLALVPLVTLIITVVSAFPGFDRVAADLDGVITGSVLPEVFSGAIRSYLEQFTRNAARLTVLGLAVLGFTAFMLVLTIERAFNGIWRVRRERSVAQRIITYWATLTLGPILIGASLTITSYVMSISIGWVHEVAYLQQAMLLVAPYILTITAFAFVYFFVPHRPVKLKHAVLGAVVSGVLFELVKRGFAGYLAHFPTYRLVYGTFAIVPIFLIWVFLSWSVAMLGAEVAAAAPDWRRHDDRRNAPSGSQFLDALDVLRTLVGLQKAGQSAEASRIAELAGLSIERAELVLHSLEDRGWAGAIGRSGSASRWTLVCDSDQVTLGDVLNHFLFDAKGHERRLHQGELSCELISKLNDLSGRLPEPLRSLVR